MEYNLTNLEKKLLKALYDIKRATEGVLLEKADMSPSELSRAVELLKSKGLITVDEILREKFKISEKGLPYVEEDLPERRVLKALKEKGNIPISKIKEEAHLTDEEFKAAIGLLKRRGFVDIENGLLKITKDGLDEIEKPSLGQRLLSFLKEEKYMDEIPAELQSLIPSLAERGLLERDFKKIKDISITPEGEKIAPSLKIEEEVSLLTPQMIKEGSWKGKKFKAFDVSAQAEVLKIGKKQPYLAFVDELKEKLTNMGFKEMRGPLVELSFFNDALFMPQDHPAREIHDIFFVEKPHEFGNLKKYKKFLEAVKKVHEKGGFGSKGWGYKFSEKESSRLVLRSQTTNVSARMLISPDLEIPGSYFTIDRNFRVDTIDWKHLLEFDQLEGIVLGDRLSFRELLGVLKMFAKEVAGIKDDKRIKFFPGYFPFTEPSVELHIYLDGKGWVEIGGAGIFRPEVTETLGVKVPVIAWGMGIFRLFMIKHGVEDMRQIFSQDLEWLRKFR